MRRRIFSLLFVFSLFVSFGFSQESEEWYWNQPIDKIDFEGLKSVKKSELTGITSSFIGQSFTADTLEEILNRFYALELFEEITPVVNHSSKSDGVALVFTVEECPVIKSINFSGNSQLRNGELRDQIKSKTSDVYIESKILLDERALRSYYLKQGYTNSSVTHTIKNTEKGVIVTFVIDEGQNTVIKSIQFWGNTIASAKKLKSKLELKEVGIIKKGAYQASTLERDKQAVVSYYREQGYVDAQVTYVKIDSELNEKKSRNELTLTFMIQEGSRYTFGGLTLSGNEVFSDKELLTVKKLKPGDVYNEVKFQEMISAVSLKYYENGYMSNSYEPQPEKDSERHEIKYNLAIKEGPRSHVENIIIKGNTKTKEHVIRREIPIEPGDTFSRDKIINGLRSLMNLQYFSNVVPEPQQGSEANLVDIVWTVEEQSTTTLNFGFTFTGGSEPESIPVSLFARIQNTNFLGEGRTIMAGVNLSQAEQSIELGYSQNWIGDLPLSWSENLTFARKNNYGLKNHLSQNLGLNQSYYYMGFEDYSASLGTAFARRWSPNYAILTLGFGLNNTLSTNLYDENIHAPVDAGVATTANRIAWTNAIWTSFAVDNRDIAYEPSKGWFGKEKLSWFGLIPGVEKEFFVRSDTTLEGYFTFFNIPLSDKFVFKLTLADITSLSMLFPVVGTITDSNRVYIDGMLNGRGWNKLARTLKGEMFLSNKLELRMPIFPNILGVDFFWDAAAIKPKAEDFWNLSLNDFYFSFGPGIRFLLPQFPLHLCFAWKYQIIDGVHQWADEKFQFVLSFNLTNK